MSALNRHSPSDTTSLSTSSASVSDRSDYSPTSSITSSEMRLSDQLPSPKFATSRGFSLLPPSHPLRAQLCTQVEGEMSPPRTPKGHPIDQQSKSYFPLSSRATKHNNKGITNPYGSDNPSYPVGITYLLRIPRRLRPYLLVAFCLFTFSFILLNRAVSNSQYTEAIAMQKQPSHSAHRYVPIEELQETNGRSSRLLLSKYATDARVAEADVQVKKKDAELLRFESGEEELAALISFVTSTTSNVIPHLDPSVPLDPSVILDFDPSHPNARDDLLLLQAEINALYPLVLYGRMRDPRYREIKRLLSEVKITPAPLVIEVDQRKDHKVFIPTVARLLGDELPVITLQGKKLGGYKEIMAMHEAGTLKDRLQKDGAVLVRELKKKKKGVKEQERIENERVLGPAPVVDDE
ncbi:glutathione transferase [Cryptococcus bacillisporus CA1873]|uniref:Glutathione transferase n=1 Tax=Cryptococcus bacillisporus CA1873 TaxID=1296111 RepID=A0ABR5B9R0_CRYGA|nr:glutathione transferase [Cryptococcus bacillisporus CA1873]|eukprot:KIR59947.1 glutathione transferase [Cryptococcus gattii CA1873]